MIKVNLLPPEYRVKEHTPLPMMLGILGGVVLTALSVLAFLYLRFGMLPEVVNALKNKQQTKEFYRQKAKKFDELVAEKSKLDQLATAVKKLKSSRYPWTKALDDLAWMVVRANKNKKSVKGWYEKLRFGYQKARGRTASAKPTGSIEVGLVVAGTNYEHVAVFRDVMRSHSYWLGKNLREMPLSQIKPKMFKDFIPDVGLYTDLNVALTSEIFVDTIETEPAKAEEKKASTTPGSKRVK